MRDLVCRSTLIIMISLCLLICDGCGGGDDVNLDEGWQWPATEGVIGPEGGTIEVTDPNSQLRGVKIEIPAGALAQQTKIVIQDKWFASSLPSGITSSYPIVEFSPKMTFSKNIQIRFPVQSIPTGDDGRILGAFFWNSSTDRWTVISPKRVKDSEMIITTTNFGVWRWGIVSLTELEVQTLTDWMDNLFGGGWAELRQRVIDQLLGPWQAVIDDPLNLKKCAVQDDIIRQLVPMRDFALQGVNNFLASENTLSKCRICNDSGICADSVCDANKLISGQPLFWAREEVNILFTKALMDAAGDLLMDGVGDLLAVYVGAGMYKEAIGEFNCDWRCVLLNGNLEFYFDVLLGNACQFSIFAIEVYRSVEGCTP